MAFSIYINKHTKKLIILIASVTVAALMTAFLIYASIYYHSDVNMSEIATTVSIEKVSENYYLTPEDDFDTGIIFYPGNKIAAESYLPFLVKLAEDGLLVVVVDMPYHLTMFGKNKAGSIIAAYPSVNFYVMGHAEGGEAAARYASKNPDLVEGLILLAAYSNDPVTVSTLSIYGTLDSVMNMDKYDANITNLSLVRDVPIDGGNHSMYGDYGLQRKDTATTLSYDVLRQSMVESIETFLGL